MVKMNLLQVITLTNLIIWFVTLCGWGYDAYKGYTAFKCFPWKGYS